MCAAPVISFLHFQLSSFHFPLRFHFHLSSFHFQLNPKLYTRIKKNQKTLAIPE